MTPEKDKPILEYIVLFALIIAPLVFFAYFKNQEVNFSRRAFTGLVQGGVSAQRMIDWPNFKALEADIGKSYLQLPDDKQRALYRKNFIKNFSLGFKQSEAKPDAFTNWRIYDSDSEKVVVAADYPQKKKTLLFTLSKLSGKRLVSMQWKE